MFDSLRKTILALPEIRDWSPLEAILERARPTSELPLWKYPCVVARSVGSDEYAPDAAAALLCLTAGVQLVDDLLDGDRDGLSAGLDAGRAANLALALHSAAHEVIRVSSMPKSRRRVCLKWVSSAGLGTARGQDLDVSAEGNDEATYWRVVKAKSQPLVRAGCALGGVVAGSHASTVKELAALGELLGTLIQVQDDVTDALAEPYRQDWKRPSRNLAILFAMTADHDDRDRFLDLLGTIEQPHVLREAQLVLTRSGAVAYCLYQVVQIFRQITVLARDIPLSDSQLLLDFLRHHVAAVEVMLRAAGLDAPEDLWQH